ncbi:DUF2179 domain-containing protein [Clostridium sediminicola]|uniref:DUF2179 domain-containing protein n=1 Tax=Clostridium sediminicola TaxID=3114879 RepID=UPI0031F2054D
MKQIILIIILQLTFVPLLTLRTIFMVKKMNLLASIFGVLESFIYVFGLSLVLSGNQTTLAMVIYALGFGLGLYVGGIVENKMAIGYTSFSVNLNKRNDEMICFLREKGFGVTLFEGEGRDSKRIKLEILTKRSREHDLLNYIDTYEPSAFIIAYEPTQFRGGFLVNSMKKRKKHIRI